jgi:hypothetical protein
MHQRQQKRGYIQKSKLFRKSVQMIEWTTLIVLFSLCLLTEWDKRKRRGFWNYRRGQRLRTPRRFLADAHPAGKTCRLDSLG